MTPTVVSAEYVAGYRIFLRFEEGRAAEVDLEGELWGEVVEAVRDPDVFKSFRRNEELNTLTWPTGADLAPEFLYECVAARQGDAAGDVPRRD